MDSINDRPEVIVKQNNVAGIFGNLRARPHCNAHVGVCECGDVVHAIASHGSNVVTLKYCEDAMLMLWHDARKYADGCDLFFELLV